MRGFTYIFFCFCSVFCSVGSTAQVVLERFVVSPFAMSASSSLGNFYATGGQEAASTQTGSTFIFTEGFQQPRELPVLLIEWNIYRDNCSHEYVAEIVSTEGCATANDLVFTWNGTPGGNSYRSEESSVVFSALSVLGCYYEETIQFSNLPLVEVPCDLLFYNIITPNADGSNDFWFIENIAQSDYSENQVTIFNRWGQVVWTARNYNNVDIAFSGRASSGEELSDGTYFYEFRSGENERTGFMEVQR